LQTLLAQIADYEITILAALLSWNWKRLRAEVLLRRCATSFQVMRPRLQSRSTAGSPVPRHRLIAARIGAASHIPPRASTRDSAVFIVRLPKRSDRAPKIATVGQAKTVLLRPLMATPGVLFGSVGTLMPNGHRMIDAEPSFGRATTGSRGARHPQAPPAEQRTQCPSHASTRAISLA
jgi:hypothetical protein